MLVNNSTCCSDRVVIKDFEKCRKAFGFDDRAQVDTVGNRINVFGAVVKQDVFRYAADNQFADEIVIIEIIFVNGYKVRKSVVPFFTVMRD